MKRREGENAAALEFLGMCKVRSKRIILNVREYIDPKLVYACCWIVLSRPRHVLLLTSLYNICKYESVIIVLTLTIRCTSLQRNFSSFLPNLVEESVGARSGNGLVGVDLSRGDVNFLVGVARDAETEALALGKSGC